MTIELDSTLAQAEVLFLSFSQLIADIDRRRAESSGESGSQLRRRQTAGSPETVPPNSAQGSSTARNGPIVAPLISDNLRELLQNTRD